MYSNITYHALILRVNVNQDNGFRGLFWGRGGCGQCYSNTTPWRRPEDTLGHPIICNAKSTARRLRETYQTVSGLCKVWTKTHKHTHKQCDYAYFSMEKFRGFWRNTVQGFFFFFFRTGTPLPRTVVVVAAGAVKKRWAAHAKWDQMQFKPLTHSCIIYIKADKPLNTLD